MRLSTCRPAGWIWRLMLGSVLFFPFTASSAGAQVPTALPATGQGNKPLDLPVSPTLTVDSDPSGAVITLRGPYVWVGQTPWRLDREVRGLYQIEARLPGYEPWHGEAVLGPGGMQRIKITLTRRTAGKALARSLLFPGWGQIYCGAKGKGIVLASAWLLALGGGLWTEFTYQDRLDTFKDAQRAFEAQRSLGSDWNRSFQDVQHASSRADRAYNHRQLVFGIAAGIYALSAVDILFFSPSGSGKAPTAEPSGSLERELPESRWGWSARVAPTDLRAGLCYRWN